MDEEELLGSIAEALEQYLGIEEVSVEDDRTLGIVVEGQRWQVRIKPVKTPDDDYEGEDE